MTFGIAFRGFAFVQRRSWGFARFHIRDRWLFVSDGICHSLMDVTESGIRDQRSSRRQSLWRGHSTLGMIVYRVNVYPNGC